MLHIKIIQGLSDLNLLQALTHSSSILLTYSLANDVITQALGTWPTSKGSVCGNERNRRSYSTVETVTDTAVEINLRLQSGARFLKAYYQMSLLAPSTAPTVPAASRSAAHGRPVLEAGHGLKDWIRLNRLSVDMSGTQGRMLRVTTHELAKHCTEDDAWTAINGEPIALRASVRPGERGVRPKHVVFRLSSLSFFHVFSITVIVEIISHAVMLARLFRDVRVLYLLTNYRSKSLLAKGKSFSGVRDLSLSLSLSLPGRVYNITPYLKFHPGSVAEIMRGAGKDCTDLFDQVRGAGRVVGADQRWLGGWASPQAVSPAVPSLRPV